MKPHDAVLNKFRFAFIKGLNTTFSIVRLTTPSGVHIIMLPDSFGAIEENLFCSIYFSGEELASADTIIDLGAHIGSFTVYAILSAKPNARLIAVEPCRRNYSVLLKNISLLKELVAGKKLSIYALNKAVWSEKRRVRISFSEWSETHHVSTNGVEEVEAVTLDELLDMAKGATVVKMDIEGAEVEVLKKLGRPELISSISIEPHSNDEGLIQILHRQGFAVEAARYRIDPSLALSWLKTKPRRYTSLVAMYRLIVSSIAGPAITIIKGHRCAR